MRVEALDHVNIQTDDVEGAVRFYADLLGLEPRSPMTIAPDRGRWMYDAADHPIIHIFNSGTAPEGPADTGAIHHVALRCSGLADMRARLEDRGVAYRVNEVPSVGLTQIFARDPHGVLLELNFPAG